MAKYIIRYYVAEVHAPHLALRKNQKNKTSNSIESILLLKNARWCRSIINSSFDKDMLPKFKSFSKFVFSYFSL